MYQDLSNNINDIIFLILNKLGITISKIDDLVGTIIYRETLLNDIIYNDVKEYIPALKIQHKKMLV